MSSSFIRETKDEVEIATTMSERDRKQLILDLQTLGDDERDPYASNSGRRPFSVTEPFGSCRGREDDRNRFANRILNQTETQRDCNETRRSLRSRLNDLKKQMGLQAHDGKESYGHQQQTSVYHNNKRT